MGWTSFDWQDRPQKAALWRRDSFDLCRQWVDFATTAGAEAVIDRLTRRVQPYDRCTLLS